MTALKAPFPYFGGKSRAADLIWQRFGDVRNYIEPCCGTAATLLRRPHPPQIETINDIDCMVANFWRATEFNSEAVVGYCDWPVNEADLHARHRWLLGLGKSRVVPRKVAAFRRRMREDPDYFNPKFAGWWVWGMCQWIGGGWCSTPDARRPGLSGTGCGVVAKRPAIGNTRGVCRVKQVGPRRDAVSFGVGVHKPPKLSGNGVGVGVHRNQGQIPNLSGDSGASGMGIHASGLVKQGRPQLADEFSRGRGVHSNDNAAACDERREFLLGWFDRLRDRLRSVRVCCGDWERVCGSRSVTTKIGQTGVMLDPPYSKEAGRTKDLYAHDCLRMAHDIRAYCIERGADPMMRLALCGLEGEHDELISHGWEVVAWKSNGGYGNRGGENLNKHRERIWFSPHCLQEESLFAIAEAGA